MFHLTVQITAQTVVLNYTIRKGDLLWTQKRLTKKLLKESTACLMKAWLVYGGLLHRGIHILTALNRTSRYLKSGLKNLVDLHQQFLKVLDIKEVNHEMLR